MIYVLFIFITTFFVMNLFISVIVRQFNAQKQTTEGSADLSPVQVEWIKIQRFMANVNPSVRCVEPTGYYADSLTKADKKLDKAKLEKRKKDVLKAIEEDQRTQIVSTTSLCIYLPSLYFRIDVLVPSDTSSGILQRQRYSNISSHSSSFSTLWPCAWNTTVQTTHTCTFLP